MNSYAKLMNMGRYTNLLNKGTKHNKSRTPYRYSDIVIGDKSNHIICGIDFSLLIVNICFLIFCRFYYYGIILDLNSISLFIIS